MGPAAARPSLAGLSEPAAAAAISAACKTLYLSGTARVAASMAEEAARARLSHQGYLAEVLTFECDEREDRRRDRRVKEARFPRPKRLEDLDLTQIPAVKVDVPGGGDKEGQHDAQREGQGVSA